MKKEWLTKSEAAAALGLQPRSVLMQADTKGGPIRAKMERAEASGQMVMMFHAGDVERERAQREEAAQAGSARAVRAHPDANLARNPLAALLPQLLERAQEKGETAEWLTLAEAAKIARGLAAVDLLDMIQAGHLPAWLARGTREKHGLIDRYRVKRTDLEALAGVRVEKANSAGAA